MRLSGWTLIFPSQKSHSDRLLAFEDPRGLPATLFPSRFSPPSATVKNGCVHRRAADGGKTTARNAAAPGAGSLPEPQRSHSSMKPASPGTDDRKNAGIGGENRKPVLEPHPPVPGRSSLFPTALLPKPISPPASWRRNRGTWSRSSPPPSGTGGTTPCGPLAAPDVRTRNGAATRRAEPR